MQFEVSEHLAKFQTHSILNEDQHVSFFPLLLKLKLEFFQMFQHPYVFI